VRAFVAGNLGQCRSRCFRPGRLPQKEELLGQAEDILAFTELFEGQFAVLAL
jgi:hypothetical protein